MPTTVEYVAESLLEAIQRGEYKPGHALPSKAAVVDTYGVGETTAQRAYEALLRDGFVEGRRGAGYFVRQPAPHLALDDVIAGLPTPVACGEQAPAWVTRVAADATGTIQIGPAALRLRWDGNDTGVITEPERTLVARAATSPEREQLELPVGATVLDVRRVGPGVAEQLVLAAADHVLRL